jgi:hypothetical protein
VVNKNKVSTAPRSSLDSDRTRAAIDFARRREKSEFSKLNDWSGIVVEFRRVQL